MRDLSPIVGVLSGVVGHREQIVSVAHKLRKSERPIVVCGTDIVHPSTPSLAADLVLLSRATGKEAGLFYLMPSANGFGAALCSQSCLCLLLY